MEEKEVREYSETLKELEKQRESLEWVMLKMGEEWEESGPGIGWMEGKSTLRNMAATTTTTHNEPSHDYLQSLLNINDQLLAQSLASFPTDNHTQTPDPCPFLSTLTSPTSEVDPILSPRTPNDLSK
ncbi:hypothetical protein BY458DRAFT_503023 [Sporodiniella umbellata]|nr:hypothetical protein BY458DRAFT_503023 [Sporodiniella umbellata]